MLKLLLSLCCIACVVSEVPDGITIEGLTYAGTGCPSDSASSIIGSDGDSLTIIFHDNVAFMKPGSSIRDTRKNCQMNVALRAPEGWSYAIGTIDYHGFVNLEEGTSASQGVLYYFAGDIEQTPRLEHTWDGPETKRYSVSDTVPPESLIWSACGAPDNLNIKSDLRVSGDPSKQALIRGKLQHVYGLKWRRC